MSIKKILFWLIIVFIVLTVLGLLGFNTFLNFRSETREERKYREQKGKEGLDEELKKSQLEQSKRDLAGFTGDGLYKIHYFMDYGQGYMGIKGIDECYRSQNLVTGMYDPNIREGGFLLLSEEAKKHFCKIVQDIDSFLNNNGQLEDEGGHRDNYSGLLVRNNCILYGAPGTGKTEFMRELIRILIERYGEEPDIPPVPTDPNDPNYSLKEYYEGLQATKGRKKARVPVIEIKGASLQSAGSATGEPLPHEKLTRILQRAKEEFYGNNPEDEEEKRQAWASKLPYVVFIEEADQARNVMAPNTPKSNLQDFKNFLSSSTDTNGVATEQISMGAQDRNSIIVIATNNYEDIDPAIKRRGRLGESLNFTWTPNTLKEYSKGDENGNFKVNWPTVGLQDHYCWKFEENEDYHFIIELSKKMNFANYKKDFVEKTNEILQKWENWDEKERDDFAKSRLGLESKVWCEVCEGGKEVNSETAQQKQTRLREAVKDIEDREEKDKKWNEEMERKLGDCEHEVKPIANWLLHYIHTFFKFYEIQNLEAFDKPKQIERYPYNEKRLLRERINQLRIDLNEMNEDTINVLGGELRNISNQLTKMEEESRQSQEELGNITAALNDIADKVNNIVSNQW